MVIYSPNLTEDEQRTQNTQVEELLRHENAQLNWVDHWGKRKLAYPVKKQRQGSYDWFYFELDSARIHEIDRKLKMSEVILRFMILKMEKIQVQNLFREIERRNQAAQPQPEPAPAATAAAEAPAAEAETPAPVMEAEQTQQPETPVETSPAAAAEPSPEE
jgi:small subunit ribosomal protein S6